MFEAHRVRAKVRAAIKRREDDVEQDEMEAGELNLIPYLDIVTNLMLFLLASVTAGIIFGQINTTLPDRAPAAATSATPPQTKPDEQPLQLVVSVKRDSIIIWSMGGLEGTLAAPKATIARTGRIGEACDGTYMCESNVCEEKKCVASTEIPQPVFDYRALNKALSEIVTRRYAGKPRAPLTYRAFLNVDYAIPYSAIISVMGAMRCPLAAVGKENPQCYLPTDDENLKKSPSPVDEVGFLYDTVRANFDPTKMAYFHDIAFLEIR